MKAFLLLTLLAITSAGFTIELRPYSKHEITAEKWDKYHAQISNELRSTRKLNSDKHTEIFTKDMGSQLIVITFTSEKHKAHPSWVTEVMIIENNQLHTQVIGYYAGDFKAFTSFYDNAKNNSEAMKDHLTQ